MPLVSVMFVVHISHKFQNKTFRKKVRYEFCIYICFKRWIRVMGCPLADKMIKSLQSI